MGRIVTVRLGVNGFGRIGRTLCRALWAREDLDVDLVAANDVQPLAQLAYLLEFDSIAGRLPQRVEVHGADLIVGARRLRMLHSSVPEDLAWGDLGVDVVIESSRRFLDADQARRHIEAGAKLVIVSAPSPGADATFVVGVNDDTFDRDEHRVVSNGSCTTNCLAPMAKVLDDAFGVVDGLMTTVHAYTSDQAIVDGASGSLRHARGASTNIVPAASGAARAIGFVLPELDGHLDGAALRVPVADGSITDLTVALKTPATTADINDAFREAARGRLSGILQFSEDPIVSSDIVGNPASCILDAPLTATSGHLAKVFGWYDNEWGYSNRLLELSARLGAQLATVPA